MRLNCAVPVVFIAALIALAVPSAQAQLSHVKTTGFVDSMVGSDLSLLAGVNVGDEWRTSYSYAPATLPLAETGTNWAIYQTMDAVSTVEAGVFTATATHFALTLIERETLTLLDGSVASADLLQLSGYSPTAGLLIRTSLYYPVGTIDRFNPVAPSLSPSVVNFELLVLIDGRSALAESYAELRSLDPELRPVPEPGTYGWVAAAILAGFAVHRTRKQSLVQPMTQAEPSLRSI
jgi:hypothetical protein